MTNGPNNQPKTFVPLLTTSEDQERFNQLVQSSGFGAKDAKSTSFKVAPPPGRGGSDDSPSSSTASMEHQHLVDNLDDIPTVSARVLPPPTELGFKSALERELVPLSQLLKTRADYFDHLKQAVDPNEPEIKMKHNFVIYKAIGLEWCWIFFAILGAMVAGVMPLIFYVLFGNFVDDAIKAAQLQITVATLKDNIINYTIGFAVIAVATGGGQLILQFFMNIAGERIAARLRRLYFNKLISQDVSYFDIKPAGELTAPLFDNVTQIQESLTTKVGLICTHLSTGIAGVIVAMTVHWKLTLILLSCAPLVVVFIVVCTKLVEIFSGRTNRAMLRAAGVANEVTGSIKTIRSMAGDERERARFSKALGGIAFSIFGKALAQAVAVANGYLFINGFFAITFWYGANLIADQTATMGELVKVFGVMLLAILGMNQAADVMPHLAKAQTAIRSILRIINRKPSNEHIQGTKTLDSIKGNISVQGIEFAYPSRPHVTVLKDFSLEIQAGRQVALVGGSGSGKSTIVGLMEQFYVPKKGRILLDGVDLTELDTIWLHTKVIGIVTQEPTLFATTIKENIAYSVGGFEGNKSIKQSDIEDAARSANAHNFIMELPEGYNTKLGEKGVSLSGGQKQRIAIARAILQNPQILLLDEATSALDAESEALVQQALDVLMKGRTTIVIAHRLSTIKNSDEICVMDHGVIRERGTHDQLVKIPGGMYRGLAERQSMVH